jgi:hypothetical protein
MRVLGVIVLAGCESGVSVEVTWRVPAEVAATYSLEAPGVLVTNFPTYTGERPGIGVCGEPVAHVLSWDHFGCKPDGVKEDTIEGWIVPMPPSWDPVALCEAASLTALVTPPDTAAEPEPFRSDELFPPGELAARSDGDPYGSTVAKWHKTPICGGWIEGEVLVQR